MTHTLITGGTGFIGAHLVRDCVARGDTVTVIARPGSDPWRLSDVAGRIDLVTLAPDDRDGLAGLVTRTRPDQVFHLAAQTRFARKPGCTDLDRAIACNVAPLRLLLDVLDAADHPPRCLIRAGTLAELGEADQIHVPGGSEHPSGTYGLSALIGTHMLRLARPDLRFAVVTARLSLTYGGDQNGDFLIADTIRKTLSGRPVDLARPNAERDLMHVDDTVAALQTAARHADRLPATIVVSTGQPVRMSHLCQTIRSLVSGAPVGAQGTVPSDGRPDGRLSSHPSPELLALGWHPRVPLRTGLGQAIAWERAKILSDTTERCA